MGGSRGLVLLVLFAFILSTTVFGSAFGERQKDIEDTKFHPNLKFTEMDEKISKTLEVGSSPIEISVDPTKNTIYVTNRDNSLSIINGTDHSVIGIVEVGSSPRGVAVNPSTNTIYVTNLLDNSLSIIDGSSYSIKGTIQVGQYPRGVAVNSNTNTIYVTNSLDDTLSIIDGSNYSIDTIAVGQFPRGVVVNPSTNTIYVAHPLDDSISVIDGVEHTVIDTIKVAEGSFGISLNPSTNKIYSVSCFYDNNSISIIDGTNNSVVDKIRVDKCALAIALNPESNIIYMPDSKDTKVSVVGDKYTLPKVESAKEKTPEPKPTTEPAPKPPIIQSIEEFEKSKQPKYKMAENVYPEFTFTFRDGVEFHKFPVFRMTSDLVSNQGTFFEVEGVVGNSPHLHQALDAAYQYRLMTSTGGSSFEHNYRFFDVDVDFKRDDKIIRTLNYYNCEILNFEAKTQNSNDYESYTSSSTGFAVVDRIEFRCGGVNGESSEYATFENIDYGTIYDFYENVRTFITFEFDDGIERIEFPSFTLNSGFGESDDSVVPSFSVQGVVDHYPLLYKAIDNSRKVSGIGSAFNTDFEALVEFSNGEKVLRALDFRDCRVSGAIVNTESDKEEGYTGKSGFALVNEIDFDCAGLKPTGSSYEQLRGNTPSWKPVYITNDQFNSKLRMTDDLRVIALFTFNDGRETLEFPIFRQGDNLSRSNPTFELEGIVGDYPILYSKVDENLRIQSVAGANLMTELFDVDVDLVAGEILRGFEYTNCRVTDYVIKSDMNAEENYIKGQFALENTFEFECQGFHPKNPMLDSMKNKKQASTKSTFDLKQTHDWEDGFYVD